MHSSISIELLGGLRIRQGEQTITRFSTQKTAALLAYLAYHKGRLQPREQLIEMLWPLSTPQAGRASLSMALSSLRHQLEPPGIPSATILIADRFAIQINAEAVETDVAKFRSSLQRAEKVTGPAEKAELLRQAASLYSGPLLPGFYEDWISGEQQGLSALYFQAVRQLIRHEVQIGDLPRALDYAHMLVRHDPLREEAHQDLMRLLAVSGQPAAALKQYRDMAALLRGEVNAAPSVSSLKLAREIEQLGANTSLALDKPSETPEISHTHITALHSQEPVLPSGTVTLLTYRAEAESEVAFEIGGVGGHPIHTNSGDKTLVFGRASDAIASAIALHQNYYRQHLSKDSQISVALHSGEIAAENTKQATYAGATLEKAAALLSAANPGQILVSEVCATLLRQSAERSGWQFDDLGIFRLQHGHHPERIFEATYEGMRAHTIPPRAESPYVAQLPFPFTRFIGREDEISRLKHLLTPDALAADKRRLITILGPGGTGKTRLAVETGRSVAEGFGGAVWFIPLADLPEDAGSRQIADSIAQALAVSRTTPDPYDQISSVLGGNAALLILDNLEQIVEASVPVVQKLLDREPRLVLLTTSRHKLELTAEYEFNLNPLSVPGTASEAALDSGNRLADLAQIESVKLFVDRAQSVKPDFQLTASNAEAISQLCERLEGIPLAIELAAARAQVLTPAQMLMQLSRQSSRFDLLVSRKRDLAERHRTLRGAIDWSFRLLAPELQSFMACLSVFRGGWSLEAAEEVLQEPLALDSLAQLRECSLILSHEVQTVESQEPEMRFRMLETLREFAADALASLPSADQTLHLHCQFFLSLAEEIEPSLRGPRQIYWLDRLSIEHDNLRAALRYALTLDRDDETGLRLVAALWRFWSIRGFSAEGRNWADEILAHTSEDLQSVHRVRALSGAGLLALNQADYEHARRRFDSALIGGRQLGDKYSIAEALRNLGILASDQKRFEDAQKLHEESLQIWRELEDRQGTASALSNLGLVAIHQKELDKARILLMESLEITRKLGNQTSIGNTLNTLGMLAYRQHDYVAAREAFTESLAIERTVGNPRGYATAHLNLGSIVAEMGMLDESHAHLEEAINQLRRAGDMRLLSHALYGLANLAARLERFPLAAATFAAVEALCESVNLDPLCKRDTDDAEVKSVRESLPLDEFSRQWERGYNLPLNDAIEDALSGTNPSV